MSAFSTKIKSSLLQLREPIHPAVLALIRIAYGVLMLWQFNGIKPYILYITEHSKFFLTYDFFHWVSPLSVGGMETMFMIAMIASGMVILGLFQRLSVLTVFLCWSYVFLIGRGHYTNHYYLFCLIGLLLLVTNSNRYLSLDKLIYKKVPAIAKLFFHNGNQPNSIPYWQVLIFQLQIFLVYFYGAIAKIHYDWLHAYPLKIWLPLKTHMPFYESFFNTEFGAYFLSYGGILFDLLIGFMLMSVNRRIRLFALPFILFFHISNHFIWQTIGGFPWFMMAATLLYFFREIESWVVKYEAKMRQVKWKPMGKSKFSLAPKWATIIVCLYLSFQTLAPLRHYLIPGNASLTGEGHLFSWRMMLVDRSYKARLKIMENGQVLGYISKRAWENYINFRQFKRICRQPQHIHRFAKFVYLEAKANNPKSNIEVYANLAVEINGRPFIQLIDSTIDLAAKPYSQFGLIDYMFEFPDIPPGSKTWLTPEEMDRWK